MTLVARRTSAHLVSLYHCRSPFPAPLLAPRLFSPRCRTAALLYKMILVFAWRFVVFDLLPRRRRVLVVNATRSWELELELDLNVVVAFLRAARLHCSLFGSFKSFR